MKIGFAVFGGGAFNTDRRGHPSRPIRNEPALLLEELAIEWPDVTWRVACRSRTGNYDLRRTWPKNVEFAEDPKEVSLNGADALLCWSVFTVSSALGETLTLDGRPQATRADRDNYMAPVGRMINASSVPVTWCVNDIRSVLKARDVRPPLSAVLSQHTFEKKIKTLFTPGGEVTIPYVNAGLAMTAVPWFQEPSMYRVGEDVEVRFLASSSGRSYRDELVAAYGAINRGPTSQQEYTEWLRSTWGVLMLPAAKDRGWATTKLWESWAHGALTFSPPDYDTQDVSQQDKAGVGQYLRVTSSDDLWQKVDVLRKDPDLTLDVRRTCRNLYEKAYWDREYLTHIGSEFGLKRTGNWKRQQKKALK